MSTKFVLNETSYFGKGAREELSSEIKNRGFKKVLLVTDKALLEVGVTGKVTKVLEDAERIMLGDKVKDLDSVNFVLSRSKK